MGYTNAGGTHSDLIAAANSGVAFAWHGGDISYADDWYSGILPCESDWPVCINGTSTELPSSPLQPAPIPAEVSLTRVCKRSTIANKALVLGPSSRGRGGQPGWSSRW